MPKMIAKLAVRVPREMKRQVNREARVRLLEPADIVREALVDYFKLRTKEEAEKQEVAA